MIISKRYINVNLILIKVLIRKTPRNTYVFEGEKNLS